MSRTLLTAGVCLALVPTVAHAQERAKSSTPVTAITSTDVTRLYYNGDLRFETADKRFTSRIGGRLHYDGIWTDDGNQATDGTRFRRGRVYIRGTVNENVDYNFAFDFAGGDADFRDAYIKYNGLLGPLYLQVGQFFAPHGLETQTSSNYMAFVERSPIDALSIMRASGIATGASFADGQGTWKAAIVNNETDSYGDAAGGHWEAAVRGTYQLPIGDTDDSFMHFGAGLTHGSSNDGIGFDADPGVSRGPDLVTLAGIPSDGIQRMNLELAAVFGAFSAQAEYRQVDIDGTTGNADTTLDGSYVQVSWFATDDVRPYKDGLFTGVKPKNPWQGWGEGTGALEFVARYSMIDFSDSPVAGASAAVEGNLITLGANWYLNQNARIMLNYNMAESEDSGGATTDKDSAVVRFQLTF
ncbi:Porin P precursor [Planctomycetes bacterium Pla163]|uniref:Porin P n=1 Tax=Rohdeia mirabilis TaxID=2528008 RepID=A0A518D4J9_9BACT|nr:Porin P precursor [Planctomycetes bacterium Pla163]